MAAWPNSPLRNDSPGDVELAVQVDAEIAGEPRLAYSAKLRVTAGSTGMPGPVVVDTVIFFR